MAKLEQLWQPFFEQAGVVILDGGLATELERRGADISGPLWSARALLEAMPLVLQLHEDYFRAGADVAITASYQASIEGFAQLGVDEQEAVSLITDSVRIAQMAREFFWSLPVHRLGRCRPLVAASVGCYGAALHDGSEYRGDYGLTVQQLMDWHKRRLDILVAAEPDVLACETIPCLEEAEALIRLLDQYPEQPAWLSFSCRDELHISQGEPLADALRLAQCSPNVVAAGVNCTPPEFVDGLLASVRATAKVPLVVYPNSGERWNAQKRVWEKPPATADWGQLALRWRDGGAKLIGGCCRTTSATIHNIAVALRS